MGLVGAVDVGVGGEVVVAVTKPGLDVLHRISQVQHYRCTAVPKVMKADPAKSVFGQQLLEFLRNEVRLQEHAHFVYADKVQVGRIITGSTELPLGQLMSAQVQKIVEGILAERERSATEFSLGHIIPDCADDVIANLLFDYCCINVNKAGGKVNG